MGNLTVNTHNLLWSYGKELLLSMLVGLLIAGGMFMYSPREWESVAEIQVGQIGVIVNTGQGSVGVSAVPIESIQVAFERIASPSFVDVVCRSIGRPDMVPQLLPKRFGGKGRLDVRQASNSDLLIVRVKTGSAELSQKVGEAIVAAIVEEHGRIAGPIEAVMRPVVSKMASDMGRGDSSAERVQLYLSQVAPLTRPTRGIGSVVTFAEPTSPRPMYFAALGVLVGIVIAAVIVGIGRFRKSIQDTPISHL